MRRVTVLLLVFGVIAPPGAPKAEEPAAQADLPAEVDALIFRNASCNWSTINRGNRSSAQVEASRRYLKCDAVVKDEAALRHKYNGDPRILEALDAKWVRVIRRVPLKIAPQTDSTAPSKEQLNGIDR
jgi:hypothetical protein